MKALRHPALHWALGIGIGAAFVYASLDKIEKPADFARIVYHYRLIGPSQTVPPVVPNAFAVTLPWIEAIAGLCLIAGLWRREAALLVSLLLAMFLVAVGWALSQGIDIQNCGCFTVGPEGRAAGWTLFLQDLGLLAGALVLCSVRPRANDAAEKATRVTDPSLAG